MSKDFERLVSQFPTIVKVVSGAVDEVGQIINQVIDDIGLIVSEQPEPKDEEDLTTSMKRDYILKHPMIQADPKAYEQWLGETNPHNIDMGYKIMKKFGDK